MKKYFYEFTVIAGFVASSFLAHAEDMPIEPTPLQLKMMQTRIFKKSSNAVMVAIKANMEDAGATNCALNPIKYEADGSQTVNTGFIQCHFPYKPAKPVDNTAATALAFIPFIGGFAAAAKQKSDYAASSAEQEKQINQIKFDLSSEINIPETTVRMRITTGLVEQKQATYPEIYDKRFKAIADSLFIEAMPIKAATQE